MNKELYNLNKIELSNEEIDKANKGFIIEELSMANLDNNDELAIILNVLEENLTLLKDSNAKSELIALLNKRESIKKNLKED